MICAPHVLLHSSKAVLSGPAGSVLSQLSDFSPPLAVSERTNPSGANPPSEVQSAHSTCRAPSPDNLGGQDDADVV